MTAGIAAKMMLSEAIRQRPASWERSSRSISRAEDAVNRRIREGPVPIVLASWTPLTDSPSSTVTLRSASSRCCSVVMARRILATLRVRKMAGGMTTSEMSDSRQHSHGERGGYHGGQVAGDGRRGGGHHGFHAADVVADPGLDLAGPGAGEERDRLPLEVGEHAGAQLVHDVLADLGADPGLDHAERRGYGGDRDHRDDQQANQPQALPGQTAAVAP